MYEIVMPQLSDSMDEGKLIEWKVKVGDSVKSGDVIAEVESDKAIMEVQTFKDGVVKELLVKEDESVSVGTVIAKIATGKEDDIPLQKQETPLKKEDTPLEKKVTPMKKQKEVKVSTTEEQKKEEAPKPHKKLHTTTQTQQISPKARAVAAAVGVDIEKMPKEQNVVHAQDVQEYLHERYFTPKAKSLLEKYHLGYELFTLDHKIDEEEVQNYIDTNEISLPTPLSSMQKAIIANVTASAQKPIYHLYESGDATLLEKHQEHSITVWLIKIIADVMMKHESFRSKLSQESIKLMPNAAISIAVANEKELYMPVVKDANRLGAAQIQEALVGFKEKLQTSSFTAKDMQGSTFGISNLGMLGVERFDAMINKNDAAILAIGAIKNGEISLTLTADHRLINGYEAGLFMRDIKDALREPLNFKEETNV